MIWLYGLIIIFLAILYLSVRAPDSLKHPPKDELTGRPPCPFYGFRIYPSIGMVDLGKSSNQCSLKGDHGPCSYIYEESGPQWPCKFLAANVVQEAVASNIRVYPHNHRHPDGTAKGISFKEWLDATTQT